MLKKLSEVGINDKALFDRYLKNANIQISELSFTNIFMWRQHYQFRYFESNGFLCLLAFSGDNLPFALFPVGGGSDELLKKAVLDLRQIFSELGHPLQFRRVPEEGAGFFTGCSELNASIEKDPANDDYVYLSKDLIGLEGKKYDGKRNHIKKFKKLYQYEYVDLTPDLIQECIRVEEEWYQARGKDSPGLLAEKIAVMEALKNYETLGCTGGVIKVDGRVEAFTFGEMLNRDTAVVHIEKADIRFEGLYTFINQQFCEHNWQQAVYVNREQDLGIEGIRRAKLSYHPVKMIRKYTVTVE